MGRQARRSSCRGRQPARGRANSMSALYPAHTIRVQRLYRASLKCLLNWTIHRDEWIREGNVMRAEFEAQRYVKDSRTIERLTSAAEAKLADHYHPAPYTHITEPGGSKYMRYPRNGKGFPPEACEMPAWIQ